MASGHATTLVLNPEFTKEGSAVVDFLAIGWGPIVNAADICVLVGVAILTCRQLADSR